MDYKNSKRLNLSIRGALKCSIKLFMMENNLNTQVHISFKTYWKTEVWNFVLFSWCLLKLVMAIFVSWIYVGVGFKIYKEPCISYFKTTQRNNFKICTLCCKNCNSMGNDSKRLLWLKDTLTVQNKSSIIWIPNTIWDFGRFKIWPMTSPCSYAILF